MFKHFFEHMDDSDRPARLFAKGEIKYVILGILKCGPSHGYEIIHFMEASFHGSYSPSAGSVYPTLQMLEDMGYVSSSVQDGKKTYAITPAGTHFLEENKEVVDRISLHMHNLQRESGRDELRDIYHGMRDMMRLVDRKIQRLDKARLKEIEDAIFQALRNIEAVIDKEPAVNEEPNGRRHHSRLVHRHNR